MQTTKIVGRKLGRMHYIHRLAVTYLPQKEQNTLEKALSLVSGEPIWNLAKISLNEDGVSLLYYQDFDSVLFPILTNSVVVKLKEGTVKVIDYSKRNNPPVLHRKELFLPPEDPRIQAWAGITKFCEDNGLFDKASHIGTVKKWEQRLLEHRYKVVGDNIIKI